MWSRIRPVFNSIHLYAGLLCGLIVIAVCFTGTLYVYNTEIREFFDSERYFVADQGTPLSLTELKETFTPLQEGKLVGVNWFEEAGRTVQFSVKKEGEEKAITYFLHPYTGEILADNLEKTKVEEFMGYVFSLHRWLLFDRVEEPILASMSNQDLGRMINGVSTLLFLLGVSTGLLLWFPKKAKNWKQGLSVRWSGNWKRINYDLHNSMAFYSLIALFIMAVTGPFWSFGWYKTSWQKTWEIYQAPKEEPKGADTPPSEAELAQQKMEDSLFVKTSQALSLDEVLATANQRLRYAGNVKLTLPEEAGGLIVVSKSRTGFFARAGADQLKLQPTDLAVKEVVLFAELPVRQQVGKSVKALHTGEIFGKFTKFLWVIACAIASSLPITGTLIWWNKRKKKKSVKASPQVAT